MPQLFEESSEKREKGEPSSTGNGAEAARDYPSSTAVACSVPSGILIEVWRSEPDKLRAR